MFLLLLMKLGLVGDQASVNFFEFGFGVSEFGGNLWMENAFELFVLFV